MNKHYRIGIDARLFGTAQAAGIGTYTEELVANLIRLDTEDKFTVFVLPEVAEFFPLYAANLEKRAVRFPHYTYSEQFLYPRALSRAGLDLIHYTNFNSPVWFRRIKSVVTIHDLTLWFYPGRKQTSWFRRIIYRYVIRQSCLNAARIIAISQGTKRDLVKYLGINPDKIDVVYEAAPKRYQPVEDPKKVEMVKTKYNISRPFFLYVGQQRHHKNLARLVRAFALLRHRYDIDYQLVLVGKADPLASEIPALIKQLNLQDAVILTGYVADSDLPYFYSEAEAFIFPSLYEGFGLPPLEAMASGIPVLSSNTSVMPEVLGEAALYFDPTNIEDIAQAMYKLATTFRLQKELRDKGFRQAKKYSFARVAKETLAVYRRALTEPPKK
ncbi:hypothetical protein A3K24_01970 [candidate division Kazan bacterium RIFCSPHIGHO2_01_FULL_44_14]|uniref:Glycosyl transferase family 1 n=1 Tax=candidate division Kazan bacterium RIFCSPLOWO2_01_FULL_45_19 TaxID=1798538 RepID=A0A1F4NQ58_UNCK3|nr:hypothetical protein [uncultured bacterium]AQS31014.1 hypothetical protein [uncultured bacterium]OGB73593.1 MAG: hypothetical protein A3K51_01970 [candidate division Kazan bacterium RIFCSPLOWO2_01_FULL_45_19]OGB77838.1 MAG: hypothetical protein A3K24_01970 [candidate division Kazan bacterium RIFCSPHIGHO2_01_FULL_44_14]